MPQAGAHRANPHHRRVPVLMYHSLDRSGSVISTAPDTFERQIESLAENGFTGLSLSDLLDGWDGQRPLPAKPVAITFDDGLASTLHLAAPILATANFGATVFAVPGFCGQSNRWPGQSSAVPRLPLLSWSGLRDVAAAGFEIGAHTVSHPRLPSLPRDEAEREIVESKRMLEDRLGVGVSSFAYPYGLASAEHRAIAAAHFRVACGTTLKMARPGHDRTALPRLDAYYFQTPALAPWIETTPGRLYLRVRHIAREWFTSPLTAESAPFLPDSPEDEALAAPGSRRSS